jgi:hypothetical protein
MAQRGKMVAKRKREFSKAPNSALVASSLYESNALQNSPAQVQVVGTVLKLNGAATVKATANNAGGNIFICVTD